MEIFFIIIRQRRRPRANKPNCESAICWTAQPRQTLSKRDPTGLVFGCLDTRNWSTNERMNGAVPWAPARVDRAETDASWQEETPRRTLAKTRREWKLCQFVRLSFASRRRRRRRRCRCLRAWPCRASLVKWVHSISVDPFVAAVAPAATADDQWTTAPAASSCAHWPAKSGSVLGAAGWSPK